MDERHWLRATDPYAMLDELFPHRGAESVEPQPRSSRLYLIACGQRAGDRLPGVCRAVVNLAERVYGGRETNRPLRDQVYLVAESLIHCRGEIEDVERIGQELVKLHHATADEVRITEKIEPQDWIGLAHLAYYPFSRSLPYFRRVSVELHSADMIREVFGNPFRPLLPMRDDWRTQCVTNLAQQAASTADFTILPILADALEDAGCDQLEVLDHLRHKPMHVRGCWALEWVLREPRHA